MNNKQLIEEIRGIRRIAINKQHGGFGISEAAETMYRNLAGITDPDFYVGEIPRDDPILIRVINQLGEYANSRFCTIKIVEIPADVEWQIAEYDGLEWVAEKHRTWE
jgi:hypothetical protein